MAVIRTVRGTCSRVITYALVKCIGDGLSENTEERKWVIELRQQGEKKRRGVPWGSRG
jgi:hypothetical protein